MKIRILSLACAVILALLWCPVRGEGPELCTEEEVLAFLAERAEGEAASFEFTCTRDLFGRLKENGFAALSLLEAKSGIASADVRYRDRTLFFGSVEYSPMPWLECADDGEILRAVSGFAAQRAGCFRLFVSPDQCRKLYSDGMLHALTAQAGMADAQILYYNTIGKIEVTGIVYSSVPVLYAADREGFLSAVESLAGDAPSSFRICFAPDFFQTLTEDRELLRTTLACAPLDDFSYLSDSLKRCFDFSGAVFSDVPRIACASEEDIVTAVRNMGAAGQDRFRLVLTGELYAAVEGSSFARLQELEAEAGMSSCALSYIPAAHVLVYSDAVIHSDAVKLRSMDEVNAFMAEEAMKNAKEITLFCTKELYAALTEDLSASFSLSSPSMAPIYDAAAQAGLFRFSFVHSAATSIITFRDIVYYPGTDILRAVRSGNGDALTDRERETLRAAAALAEACLGADDPETALHIHDALAGMIVYTDDDSTDEDDTAVGALLDGRANCDGYADAFFVTCALAGLNVRYQHGDTRDAGADPRFQSEATHMWNLVEIDGTWRMVDVTWDDSGDRLSRIWFNLGHDRASLMHIWNAEMTVPLDPVTDLSARPENEYTVSGAREAVSAVRSALKNGYTSFDIVYTDDAAAAGHEDLPEEISRRAESSCYYSWNEGMRTLSVWFESE